MKIVVPFIYEALIIKPRCKNPVVVLIKDSTEINLQQVTASEIPVAFKIGNTELRWDGVHLWDYDYLTVSDENPSKVSIETVLKNTLEQGANYKYSDSGCEAPFHNFWHDVMDTMRNRHPNNGFNREKWHGIDGWLKDEKISEKSQVTYREWVDDNRESVIASAQSIADNLLVVDGIMFKKVNEPLYEIMTFGLGHNHGGTSILITTTYDCPEYAFNALQYEAACKFGDKIASERGDTNYLPMGKNIENIIEVLIPEAVRLDPQGEAAVIAAVGDLNDLQEPSGLVNVSRLYLVSGRIPGDIEDKQHIVEANNIGEAEELFRVKLVSDIGGHEGLIDDVILNNLVKLSAAINDKICA